MDSWLFVGPTPLSGIGQVVLQYAKLVNGEYCEVGKLPTRTHYDHGFAFVLPIEQQLNVFDGYKPLCTDWIYMTVCETEPVNPAYGLLARYGTIHCPSEFARSTLERQFPSVTWKLLRHYADEKPHRCPIDPDHGTPPPYTFYTIGNIIDPRKNIQGLVNAFLACNFGTAARLVLKATCIRRAEFKAPGVVVIEGLLSDDDLDRVHNACHCYVNCSHSEGVGMGAVEAALRSKPVIITDYGGLKEYIQSPWVVPCTKGPIGFDDFLFTRNLEWGFPSQNHLMACLKDCFEKRVTFCDHTHTKELVRSVKQHLLRLPEACPDSQGSSS
jgi:glycosyltransferase involved in cell wall biosynthesis